jgi:SAM-dependent methyltransferase
MATEKELQELAIQLSNPEGDFGLELATEMGQTNLGMTKSAMHALSIKPGDQVLEIGHANASHLGYLLSLSPEISYTGLEISQTMYQEAKDLNSHLAKEGMIRFCRYEGEKIPFPDSSFTKIFTVNTVYFWRDPLAFAKEISRVLHPSGRFALVFGKKTFMKNLPFTRFGFQLYDTADLVELVEKVGMRLESADDYQEEVSARSGEKITRDYTLLVFSAKT